MKSSASGEEMRKKSYSTGVQDNAQSSDSCPFCCFVLTIYPTLKGLTPRDDEMFREHLTLSHGLREEILP